MISLIKKHLDFKFNIGALIALIVVFIYLLTFQKLPPRFGYENGVIENIQMFVLFLACFFSLKTKDIDNKKFFTFVFLVVLILILREVNYGRTLFFPIPNVENAFYSWSEIKYGFLAEPLVALYLAIVGLYFIVNKLWKNFFDFLFTTKLPFFNILFGLFSMLVATYSEKYLHNDILEEVGELIMYISLTYIIYLYSNKKQNNKLT